MLAIKHPDIVPPGGAWVYVDPDTKARFKSNSLAVLQRQVAKHKQARAAGLDPSEFVANICANASPGVCADLDPKEPSLISMARHFGEAMASWAAADGFHTVSKQVLAGRVAICETCEYWAGKKGQSIILGRCRLCGCNGVKLALPSQACPRGLWPAA
jgi:hypothetical protein